MMRFLMKLEYRRRNYERRKAGRLATAGNGLFAIAVPMALVGVLPSPMFGVGVAVAALLAALGVLMLFTVFLAPIGLLLA
ncbi:MAG: hypothetical protein V3R87_13205 [Dehalococcoidia bacterium]